MVWAYCCLCLSRSRPLFVAAYFKRNIFDKKGLRFYCFFKKGVFCLWFYCTHLFVSESNFQRKIIIFSIYHIDLHVHYLNVQCTRKKLHWHRLYVALYVYFIFSWKLEYWWRMFKTHFKRIIKSLVMSFFTRTSYTVELDLRPTVFIVVWNKLGLNKW